MSNHLRGIISSSLDAMNSAVNDQTHRQRILQSSFESALTGIRKGEMTYENDALMPILREQMDSRIESFKGLSAEEEGKLLSLTSNQKTMISGNDKRVKGDYLSQPPQIANAGVKLNPKYKSIVEQLAA